MNIDRLWKSSGVHNVGRSFCAGFNLEDEFIDVFSREFAVELGHMVPTMSDDVSEFVVRRVDDLV